MFSYVTKTFRQRVSAPLLIVGAVLLVGCGTLAIRDTDKLLAPRLPLKEILGFVAGFGTTFAALPDVLAMIKRRSSVGMNPRMAAIMGSFQIVWVYYGLLIASRPVVLWNVIAVATNFFTVGAYFYYARCDRRNRSV